MLIRTIAFTLLLAVVVSANLYIHNPRGSNNRLDEANRNRNDANRLFDSQNNNKGGYNVNRIEYYGGSLLDIDLTFQHGCGFGTECQIIMQYMCDSMAGTGLGIRNGQQQTRIPEQRDDDHRYGRHESASYWADCKARQRNLGLFLADQIIPEDATAMRTRQNNDENANNRRRGYECPEERDYYPYWHPSPWKDIAIYTSRADELCPIYTAESQNVKGKHYCAGLREATPENPITNGAAINNQAQCEAVAEFEWVEAPAWGLPPPACLQMSAYPPNRVTRLRHSWKLPIVTERQSCVFRARYNVSSADYDGWSTFADLNGNTGNYAWQTNPTVDVGSASTNIRLKLTISTDQMGRTFQDRSSTFMLRPAPYDVDVTPIVNLNVAGSRGNPVQNFPSIEYEFTPKVLTVDVNTFIHRQVTGSNTTPDGAGHGADETDRSNFVAVVGNNPKRSYVHVGNSSDPDVSNDLVAWWGTLGGISSQMDDVPPYVDLGLHRYRTAGTRHYLCTRNTDFSSRTHRGSIVVNDAPGGVQPPIPSSTTGTVSTGSGVGPGSGGSPAPAPTPAQIVAAGDGDKERSKGIGIGIGIGLLVSAVLAGVAAAAFVVWKRRESKLSDDDFAAPAAASDAELAAI
ncbi:uncharacterized protein AMSG_07563 [Thecamonas trahens ATCC 50062]|uniref:Uncharacterized protein n=1 Tax=Thecamonas trahens ATCC 50062 TaxID=461836 RepID=A0A0L0DGC1_THETB|nr:hypothetical protein AMSG_07563 [Thecamonas trahens ATCC 50062]KNC51382.1 hypothetical protein AMSG_07563 [Thecamonas trahens ATCC 50062]|eukprot:XP_013756050.1 hypothetical protein AMSG_07563 [Thecamonas trahens ATCC 50062]